MPHQSFVRNPCAVRYALAIALYALVTILSPNEIVASERVSLSSELTAAWRDLLRRPQDADTENAHTSDARPSDVRQAKVALGAALFRDVRLSGPRDRSCATCHRPDLAFTDGRLRAAARDGSDRLRNTPSLWNVGSATRFNWDGSKPSLEAQALGPLLSPLEMHGNFRAMISRLEADPRMRSRFAAAFPDATGISQDSILAALAAYTRSLVSPSTPFDAWAAGDDTALTTTELDGFAVFVGKGHCATCHRGWRFTDDALHDIGLPISRRGGRNGRTARTAFKTPSLREVIHTGPYMHDGSLPTLRAVLRHYSGGLVRRGSLSPNLNRDLVLSEREIDALLAFLKTLSTQRGG
ncbi:MAG: cytochrome c peroxidase [Pseudomonadota bacterium]